MTQIRKLRHVERSDEGKKFAFSTTDETKLNSLTTHFQQQPALVLDHIPSRFVLLLDYAAVSFCADWVSPIYNISREISEI